MSYYQFEQNILRDIEKAAMWIEDADEIFIGAGAGMGVDSGLPDFRGSDGFWKAYPALGKSKISFAAMANPGWFELNPRQAWGFYGHRLNMYREAQPHAGFELLKYWVASKRDYMIYTSNVDGQFQKSGFPEMKVVECHGSIHHLQCTLPCSTDIWTATELDLVIDSETVKLISPIPRCPNCGRYARPNICMFNDEKWISDRTSEQEELMGEFIRGTKNLVSIEIGAGIYIASVRQQMGNYGSKLIRINPVHHGVEKHRGLGVGLPFGGLEGLCKIERVLRR
ncbi:MAG: NAD-dependent deacetylase [Hahellaceae bacterium]|nr:NAD-dependent deacetylase [Hahellaceae bacterium]